MKKVFPRHFCDIPLFKWVWNHIVRTFSTFSCCYHQFISSMFWFCVFLGLIELQPMTIFKSTVAHHSPPAKQFARPYGTNVVHISQTTLALNVAVVHSNLVNFQPVVFGDPHSSPDPCCGSWIIGLAMVSFLRLDPLFPTKMLREPNQQSGVSSSNHQCHKFP